jgi:uncharacterized protein (TIGR04255 family)
VTGQDGSVAASRLALATCPISCKVLHVRRTRPPLRLLRSPLVLVLAQVRFASVLQMATYVPAIQERLRKAGYPRFSETLLQEFLLGPTPNSAPSMSTRNKWVFADRDTQTAVALTTDFVAFETVAYDTFDRFVEAMGAVLEIVGSEANIELSERVGLRYIDLVRPLPGDRLNDYLAPGLAGLEPLPEAEASQTRMLMHGASQHGQFIVRLTKGTGAASLPPDLQPSDLLVVLPGADGEYALLDIDHGSAGTRGYDVDSIMDDLWGLHDLVDGLFRSAATPHARLQWGAQPVEGV